VRTQLVARGEVAGIAEEEIEVEGPVGEES
jgi:hypothetical protein